MNRYRAQAVLHPCMRCRIRMDRIGGRLMVVPVGIKRKHWKSHQKWHESQERLAEAA